MEKNDKAMRMTQFGTQCNKLLRDLVGTQASQQLLREK